MPKKTVCGIEKTKIGYGLTADGRGFGLSKKELGNDGGACVMGKLRDTRVGHLAPRHLCTLLQEQYS